MLIDSHAHYYDKIFSEECEGGADELLTHLFSEGYVDYIINVGEDIQSSRECISQAKKYKNMYVAAGIHPSDTKFCKDINFEMSQLKDLLDEKETSKVIALGEIGLDYHYPDTDKNRQKEYFRAQLEIASCIDIPVIIHDREAHGDVFDILNEYPDVNGVLHSYSGSCDMALQLIRRGWYISFSGTITFKNAPRVRDVASKLPLERLLIETDCPYLTPHPHRGKLNHSGYLKYTAEVLGSLHRINFDEISMITSQNASRLFGINI